MLASQNEKNILLKHIGFVRTSKEGSLDEFSALERDAPLQKLKRLVIRAVTRDGRQTSSSPCFASLEWSLNPAGCNSEVDNRAHSACSD